MYCDSVLELYVSFTLWYGVEALGRKSNREKKEPCTCIIKSTIIIYFTVYRPHRR